MLSAAPLLYWRAPLSCSAQLQWQNRRVTVLSMSLAGGATAHVYGLVVCACEAVRSWATSAALPSVLVFVHVSGACYVTDFDQVRRRNGCT